MVAGRRSWIRRAGIAALVVFAAVVTGAFGTSGIAYADAAFGVSNPTPLADFHPNDIQTLSVKVTDNGEQPPGPTQMKATLTLSMASDFTVSASGCTFQPDGSCPFALPASGAVTITYTIKAKSTITDVPQGQSKQYDWQVVIQDSVNQTTLKQHANLFGNAKPVVVSGTVIDGSTGKPVSGAMVLMRDASNREFRTTTGSSGKFSFTSTPSNPIVGALSIGAAKKNFKTTTITVNAGSKSTGLQIRLPAVAQAAPSTKSTPSDTPSTDASASASDSSSASESAAAQAGPAAPARPTPPAAGAAGSPRSSWCSASS